ncbi:MAG TPA: hypothetical protein VFU89_07425, partial [Rhabdochlamydiaceae bacterium]|nr:hypothetical protein [Rhabdochlamydiaceae bacterium]
EAGRGLTAAKEAVTCVAALVIPDSQLDAVNTWFLKLESEYGQTIKGRKIDQPFRDRILKELLNFDVFVECTAIDMSLHSISNIETHRDNRATFIENNPPTQNPFLQKMKTSFAERIRATKAPLYLQTNLMWNLVELVLRHATIYYSQKKPEELGVFHWIIDPKEAGKITAYENLWKELVLPYLQCRPSFTCIEGHDYTHLERFAISEKDIEQLHTDSGKKLCKEDRPLDLKKIMTEYLEFPNDKDAPCLRLVDVIVNAIFRCLNGGTAFKDYQNIGALFFKRTHSNCVSLQSLEVIPQEKLRQRPYRNTLLSIENDNRPIWLS